MLYKFSSKGHSESVTCVAINHFDESNNIIASLSDDQSARLWDLRMNSSAKYFDLKKIDGDVGNILFNSENNILVSKGKNVNNKDFFFNLLK